MEKYKKKFLHIIPNLDFGGAESFLLRLIPHLEGQHLILTLFVPIMIRKEHYLKMLHISH